MTGKRDYHHGNLKEALIDAGIEILDEVGWDALSLRACASRAGVSHAAPAHHFGNVKGLQTALAAVGFTRFRETLSEFQEAAESDPKTRLQAAGAGYVTFALRHPGLFKLMFGGADLDYENEDYREASQSAFAQLGEIVAPFLPPDSRPEEDYRLRVTIWSAVHGYTHLLLAGKLWEMSVSDDGLSHLPDLTKLVS
ncbi:MAG: TetR/AcrR family transcriptional regulator [Alphaproteobacteria bacterium]